MVTKGEVQIVTVDAKDDGNSQTINCTTNIKLT
jgi:hypothetical protein